MKPKPPKPKPNACAYCHGQGLSKVCLAEVLTFSQVAYNGPQVVAVALHGVYRAVMGWLTPLETLGKCGEVKIVQLLFGGSDPITLYLANQSERG